MDGIERTFIRVRMRQYWPAIYAAACVIVAGSALTLHRLVPVASPPAAVVTELKKSEPKFVPVVPRVKPSPAIMSSHKPEALSVDPTSSGGDGGSLCPLTDKNDSVRVKREDVRISFDENDDYAVLVDSVYRNEGPKANIGMAIPESGVSYDVQIMDVSVRVDGHRTKIHRRVVAKGAYEPEVNAMWVIHVPFRHGQSRHIRMRYRSSAGGGCGIGMYYEFADGEWLGSVGERTLTLVDVSKLGGAEFCPTIDGANDPDQDNQIDVSMRHQGRRYFQRWVHCRGFDKLCVSL